jgi:hypothetical protein
MCERCTVADEVAAKLPSVIAKDGGTVNITIVVGVRVESDILLKLAEEIRRGRAEKRK